MFDYDQNNEISTVNIETNRNYESALIRSMHSLSQNKHDEFINLFIVIANLKDFYTLNSFKKSNFRKTLKPTVVIFLMKLDKKEEENFPELFITKQFFDNFKKMDFFYHFSQNPLQFLDEPIERSFEKQSEQDFYLVGLNEHTNTIYTCDYDLVKIQSHLNEIIQIGQTENTNYCRKMLDLLIPIAKTKNLNENLSFFQKFILSKLDEFLYIKIEFYQFCFLKIQIIQNPHVTERIKSSFAKVFNINELPRIFKEEYKTIAHGAIHLSISDLKLLINEFVEQNLIKQTQKTTIFDLFDEIEKKNEKLHENNKNDVFHQNDNFSEINEITKISKQFLHFEIKTNEFIEKLFQIVENKHPLLKRKYSNLNLPPINSPQLLKYKSCDPYAMENIIERRRSQLSEPVFMKMSSLEIGVPSKNVETQPSVQKTKKSKINMPENISDEDSRVSSRESTNFIKKLPHQNFNVVSEKIIHRQKQHFQEKITEMPISYLYELRNKAKEESIGDSIANKSQQNSDHLQSRSNIETRDFKSTTSSHQQMIKNDNLTFKTPKLIFPQKYSSIEKVEKKINKKQNDYLRYLIETNDENLEIIVELFEENKDEEDFVENLKIITENHSIVSSSNNGEIEKTYSFGQNNQITNSFYSFDDKIDCEKLNGSKKSKHTFQNFETNQPKNFSKLKNKSISHVSPDSSNNSHHSSVNVISEFENQDGNKFNSLGIKVDNLFETAITFGNMLNNNKLNGTRKSIGVPQINLSKIEYESSNSPDNSIGKETPTQNKTLNSLFLKPKKKTNESFDSNSSSVQSFNNRLKWKKGLADSFFVPEKIIDLKKIKNKKGDETSFSILKDRHRMSMSYISNDQDGKNILILYQHIEKLIQLFFCKTTKMILSEYDILICQQKIEQMEKQPIEKSTESTKNYDFLKSISSRKNLEEKLVELLNTKTSFISGFVFEFFFAIDFCKNDKKSIIFEQIVDFLKNYSNCNFSFVNTSLHSRDFAIIFQKELFGFLENNHQISVFQNIFFSGLIIYDELLILSFLEVLLINFDIKDYVNSLYMYQERHAVKFEFEVHQEKMDNNSIIEVKNRIQGLVIHMKNYSYKSKMLALEKQMSPDFCQLILNFDLTLGWKQFAEIVINFIKSQKDKIKDEKGLLVEIEENNQNWRFFVRKIIENMASVQNRDIKNLDEIIKIFDGEDKLGLNNSLQAILDVYKETDDKGDLYENIEIFSRMISEIENKDSIFDLKKILKKNNIENVFAEMIIDQTFIIQTANTLKLEGFYRFLVDTEDFDEYIDSMKIIFNKN